MAEKDKFADELMSDEELDGVAGGWTTQTADDNHALYVAGLVDRDLMFAPVVSIDDVAKANIKGWAKIGVAYIANEGSSNQYFVNGMPISRDEALDRMWKSVGR